MICGSLNKSRGPPPSWQLAEDLELMEESVACCSGGLRTNKDSVFQRTLNNQRLSALEDSERSTTLLYKSVNDSLVQVSYGSTAKLAVGRIKDSQLICVLFLELNVWTLYSSHGSQNSKPSTLVMPKYIILSVFMWLRLRQLRPYLVLLFLLGKACYEKGLFI